MAAVVQVREVGKSFRHPSGRRDTVREQLLDLAWPRRFREFRALDGVSFDVQRGETLGIMGPNGSGKSTLLKILAGIYQPDQGSVTVSAPITPILELGIGWNPELDAIDNILLIGSVMGLSLAELEDATDEILAFAQVEQFAKLKLQHYSSGMAARLAYAVAFKAVREVLLVDEIFAVGDAAFRARCESRYRELRASGHTVVLVSHNPRIVSGFCDRALLLDGGNIVLEDRGETVAEAYLALQAKGVVSFAGTHQAKSMPGF